MIRRLLLAIGSLMLLGGPAPMTRLVQLPARPGVPAHIIRVMLWSPSAGGPHPVLVYEPGWGGTAGENSRLAEALAGKGFFVAAIDYAADQPAAFADEMQRLLLPLDLSSNAALYRTIAEGDRRAVLMAGDASAALDLIPEAAGAPGYGILGWSFGGAVALEACRQDSRFRACLNMDGWMFGPAARQPPSQDYLVMSGDPYPAEAAPVHDPESIMDERDAERLRARMATVGGTYVHLSGYRHDDFSDAGARDVVRTIAAAFFSRALLGIPSPLLSQGRPMPGVTVLRFPG